MSFYEAHTWVGVLEAAPEGLRVYQGVIHAVDGDEVRVLYSRTLLDEPDEAGNPVEWLGIVDDVDLEGYGNYVVPFDALSEYQQDYLGYWVTPKVSQAYGDLDESELTEEQLQGLSAITQLYVVQSIPTDPIVAVAAVEEALEYLTGTEKLVVKSPSGEKVLELA